MSVSAVIFDWGGTLTPWHDIDHDTMWLAICAPHSATTHSATTHSATTHSATTHGDTTPGDAGAAARMAASLRSAEIRLWENAEREHRSATLDELLSLAGVQPTEAFFDSYFEAWEPHTFTDPDAPDVLRELRRRGIKIGVLSNTMWPRTQHERIFDRDGVLGLIDGAVYSSEIPWTKPHPEAFQAAMAAVGVTEPAECVFVGDRPFDDVHGARGAGMRTVLVPNSAVPTFADAEPDAIIERLAELPGLIENW